MERVMMEKGKIIRHSVIELTEHWLLAVSGLLLIFSGFGELPMYKRFMVTQVPGLGWAGDYFINLKIHYLAGIAFVSVMVFHAFYHGWLGHQGLLPKKGDMKASLVTILSMFGFGEEPKSHKYLPEQRLAYAYLGAVGLILVVTGVVKVIKNLPDVYLSPAVITGMTLTHTFATVFFLLGVIAHLVALIFKVNRPLVRSIFTREVDLEYIRERHTFWYEDLARNKTLNEVAERVDEKKKKEDNIELGPVEVEESVEKPRASDAAPGDGLDKEEDKMANVLKVKGMSCQHCVMSVTKALNQLEGIESVQVDLAKGEVRFDNKKDVPSNRIVKAIEDAGFEVVP